MSIRSALHPALLTLSVPTLAFALASPAAAVPPERFTFDVHEESEFPICDIDTRVVLHETGSGLIRYRDGIGYFTVKYDGHIALTRESTGKTVNLFASFIDRDAKIEDNGDGTITVEAHSIINERDYAPDGTLGLRTVGQQKALITIDLNGTPDDFDDDVELDFEFLGFTGRDDREATDFCDWYDAVTS